MAMSSKPLDVVVAGHLCVDITPELSAVHAEIANLIRPGCLIHVGPPRLSLGGIVANSGLALHNMGARVALLGIVGEDWLGDIVLSSLRRRDPSLAKHIRTTTSESSSYTIVVSPPNVDRAFLHCPGANDAFCASDLNL